MEISHFALSCLPGTLEVSVTMVCIYIERESPLPKNDQSVRYLNIEKVKED